MTGTRDWAGEGEPTLDEVLGDPIVRAMMRRDGLVREDVEAAISRALGAAGSGGAARETPRAAA